MNENKIVNANDMIDVNVSFKYPSHNNHTPINANPFDHEKISTENMKKNEDIKLIIW